VTDRDYLTKVKEYRMDCWLGDDFLVSAPFRAFWFAIGQESKTEESVNR
jgi:hypothetical protein